MTYLALSITFLSIGYCAWSSWTRIEWQRFVYWAFFVILFLIALTRNGVDDPDYDNYVSMYKDPDGLMVEPTFVSLAYVAKWAGGVLWLFAAYACLGIYFKMLAIKRLIGYSFLALLLYVSKIYVLHDMIQMRVAVASGLLLLSVEPLYNHKYLNFILLAILATMFHYSAALIFTFLLFPKTYFPWKVWILVMLVCLFMYTNDITLSSGLSLIGFEAIQYKVDVYSHIKNLSVEKSAFPVIKVLVLGLLFFNFKQCAAINPYVILLTQIYLLALCFYMLFFDIYAIALRVNELLGIVDVILIPMLVYTFRPFVLSKIMVWLLACYLFYISMFSGIYYGYNL